MLGLGVPRLKPRPSLLDLLASRGVEDFSSVGSSSPPGLANLPPLPDSPTSTTSSWSYSNSNARPSLPLEHKHSPPIQQNLPSSSIRSIHTPASRTMASDVSEERGSVFSVSGSVIVAENMIGCAMYELVRLHTSCDYIALVTDSLFSVM